MAAVDVTSWHRATLFVCLMISGLITRAAVLPEDRADIMYHSYDGGGVTIDGPSILVRKDFAGKVSTSANYYVDNVSSASIDVEVYAGATRYTEERTEYSLSADYLLDKTILSAGYTNSEENDYTADTYFVGVSQDFFGDLTTLSLSYARGDDQVMQNQNADFKDEVDRQSYRFGMSQIITPKLLMNLNYETITEEGFLNNPYRRYRYLNPNGAGYLSEQEVYPFTRTSDALAIGAIYHLPYRASVHGEYRYFSDDWEIDAHTYKISYTHPLSQHWIFDVSYRHYSQEAAYFYSDLFQFQSVDEKDFRARDKELSQFTTQTIGLGVSYDFQIGDGEIFDRSSINFQLDHILFDYDNFRDLRQTDAPLGEEPLYSFEANVIRVFFSVWY